jgi:hypothetical protein
MTQTPVTEDQDTPILDALAEEVGFDPNAEPDTTGDG